MAVNGRVGQAAAWWSGFQDKAAIPALSLSGATAICATSQKLDVAFDESGFPSNITEAYQEWVIESEITIVFPVVYHFWAYEI